MEKVNKVIKAIYAARSALEKIPPLGAVVEQKHIDENYKAKLLLANAIEIVLPYKSKLILARKLADTIENTYTTASYTAPPTLSDVNDIYTRYTPDEVEGVFVELRDDCTTIFGLPAPISNNIKKAEFIQLYFNKNILAISYRIGGEMHQYMVTAGTIRKPEEGD
jgi:hypothetical protein